MEGITASDLGELVVACSCLWLRTQVRRAAASDEKGWSRSVLKPQAADDGMTVSSLIDTPGSRFSRWSIMVDRCLHRTCGSLKCGLL